MCPWTTTESKGAQTASTMLTVTWGGRKLLCVARHHILYVWVISLQQLSLSLTIPLSQDRFIPSPPTLSHRGHKRPVDVGRKALLSWHLLQSFHIQPIKSIFNVLISCTAPWARHCARIDTSLACSEKRGKLSQQEGSGETSKKDVMLDGSLMYAKHFPGGNEGMEVFSKRENTSKETEGRKSLSLATAWWAWRENGR